jgi:hypothetical protein
MHAMPGKIQQDYRIKTQQRDFMLSQGIERSPWIRQKLDDAMSDDRQYPVGDQRRKGEDLVRTSASIKPEHKRFIKETGLNFSLFVDEAIDELMR